MFAIRDSEGRFVGRSRSKAAAHRATRRAKHLGGGVNRAGVRGGLRWDQAQRPEHTVSVRDEYMTYFAIVPASTRLETVIREFAIGYDFGETPRPTHVVATRLKTGKTEGGTIYPFIGRKHRFTPDRIDELARRNRAGARKAPEEKEAGFAIGVYRQDLIEANAEERFGQKYGDKELRAEMIAKGYVDDNGTITEKGWEVLNEDIRKLEANSMSWLRKKFVSARDDGHDHHDDLVGSVWYNPRSKSQRELIEIGKSERIDMVDTSFGDLGDSVWSGVSDFGGNILGGAINFS